MQTMRRRRPLGGLLFLLLLALSVWSVWSGAVRVPDAWSPFAPLRIDDAPNWLTRHKLMRASADRTACSDALAQAGMQATPLEDRQMGEGCGFEHAYRISRSSVDTGAAFELSCRAALSLAMWERHGLQQAAQSHLGSGVAAIEHYGSYACRNLYGRQEGRRSQHATADAFDVAGFVLEDGRRIRVLEHWRTVDGEVTTVSGTTAEADFLREVRDGACQWFDAVLGPDYNAAHADHFHFDRGRARICR